MGLSLRHYLYFWGSTALLFIGFVWVFKPVLTPFVLGIAIAYLLDPIIEKLVQWKVPRLISIISILFLFATFVITTIIFAAPPLAREASALAQNVPVYFDQLIELISPYLTAAEEQFGGSYVETLQNFARDNIGNIAKFSGNVAGTLASGSQAVVNFLTILVLTPLVSFFTLMEWPRITKFIDDLIPRHKEEMIKDLLTQMNQKVAGFVRGQITTAFILGVLYAIALTVAGLNYGFLIGMSAGILSIIPLVGSTIGLVVSIAVAWFQMGDWGFVAIIAAIFVIGQLIEGNILAPKLLGDSVGLHPLWILFALMAGGSLFGILGMLLAVPVAAIIGVLCSFAILQYKKSPLYKQPEEKKAAPKKSASKKTTKKKAPRKVKTKTVAAKK